MNQRKWEKEIWMYFASELAAMTHEELVDQIGGGEISDIDQDRIVLARSRVQQLMWNKT